MWSFRMSSQPPLLPIGPAGKEHLGLCIECLERHQGPRTFIPSHSCPTEGSKKLPEDSAAHCKPRCTMPGTTREERALSAPIAMQTSGPGLRRTPSATAAGSPGGGEHMPGVGCLPASSSQSGCHLHLWP